MAEETLEVKNLNTLTCRIEDEKMVCTIHSLDEHEGHEIIDVYSVSGDINVLSGGNGKMWIKTSPYIGLDATITVKERVGEPALKDVYITTKSKE